MAASTGCLKQNLKTKISESEASLSESEASGMFSTIWQVPSLQAESQPSTRLAGDSTRLNLTQWDSHKSDYTGIYDIYVSPVSYFGGSMCTCQTLKTPCLHVSWPRLYVFNSAREKIQKFWDICFHSLTLAEIHFTVSSYWKSSLE